MFHFESSEIAYLEKPEKEKIRGKLRENKKKKKKKKEEVENLYIERVFYIIHAKTNWIVQVFLANRMIMKTLRCAF